MNEQDLAQIDRAHALSNRGGGVQDDAALLSITREVVAGGNHQVSESFGVEGIRIDNFSARAIQIQCAQFSRIIRANCIGVKINVRGMGTVVLRHDAYTTWMVAILGAAPAVGANERYFVTSYNRPFAVEDEGVLLV